jgi:hypothetical protein
MDSSTLKHLQVEIDRTQDEYNRAKEKALVANQDCEQLRKRLEVLRKQLKASTDTAPIVSEHALLRYVERVLGIDLDTLRHAIMPPKTRQMVDKFRSGEFPTEEEGIRAVAKNGVIVTILKD